MIDETTDKNGRFLVSVLVGSLETLDPPFLVELTEVTKIRSHFKNVDSFIMKSKKIFTHSPRRQRIYKEVTSLTLPPSPTLTRWNTWLYAVLYFTENLGHFEQFLIFMTTEEPEAVTFADLLEMVQNAELQRQLVFISSNFKILSDSIEKYQGRLSIERSLKIIEDVKSSITHEPFAGKLNSVLSKNPGLAKMIEYKKILDGVEPDGSGALVEPLDALKFKNAPLLSAEVERMFSSMGEFQAPQRLFLMTKNLNMFCVIYWYYTVVKKCDQ